VNERCSSSPGAGNSAFAAAGSNRLRSALERWGGRYLRIALVVAATGSTAATAVAQDATSPHSVGVSIHGSVLDSGGKYVVDALVRLQRPGVPDVVETKTNADGIFEFLAMKAGEYTLTAQKSGLRSKSVSVSATLPSEQDQVHLVLEDSSAPLKTMEFADTPNFTVAGITDWTAVGGHGSDLSMRTSEALTRETLSLKPETEHDGANAIIPKPIDQDQVEDKLRAALSSDPSSYAANHQLGEFYLQNARYKEAITLLQSAYQIDPANHGNEYDLTLALKEAGQLAQSRGHIQRLLSQGENASYHRLAGELDEKLADPLAAVNELEQAVRLDPSEQSYFEWGSELLLHRAVWQAQEVFQKGAEAYPKSARMLTALGTALFASARYDEAATRLCRASDLNPSDPEPYMFMGKVEIAAPDRLPCVEQKLARFVEEQPDNSLANYFYAMALWKRQQQSVDPRTLQQVETLLMKAVTINAKYADGYLQLGVLRFSQRRYDDAIGFYARAVEANPQLGEAHYRLGVAYDRIGETAKAKQEFAQHDEIEKRQAAAIEEQRREIKQFQVVPKGASIPPPAR